MTRRPGAVALAHALSAVVLLLVAATFAFAAAAGQPLADGLPYLVLLLVTLGTGWVLAARAPANAVGWLLIGIPGLFVLPTPIGLLEEAIRGGAPGSAAWLEVYTGAEDDPSFSWVPPVWLLLCQLPLRFPDGRLPSRRWRPFAVATVVVLVLVCVGLATAPLRTASGLPNPVHLSGTASGPLVEIGIACLAACFLASNASLLLRYRRGSSQLRAQLRWVLWAVAVAVLGLVGTWLVLLVTGGPDADGAWLSWVLLLYALIPVAIAVAVLRYRLYEIDRIISRTAAYLLLTLTVVGTYAVVVVTVSQLSRLLPQSPPLAVPIATLAAAAVFLPALRVIRRAVDRIFDRARYDAERIVDAFGRRVRDGADPHTAATELVAAVDRTLDPVTVGLWTAGAAR